MFLVFKGVKKSRSDKVAVHSDSIGVGVNIRQPPVIFGKEQLFQDRKVILIPIVILVQKRDQVARSIGNTKISGGPLAAIRFAKKPEPIVAPAHVLDDLRSIV
ncbi:hypothetical protein CRBSH125_29680 [Afipia carboxidovorans]|nr:hypothetical protein CRBSH125_29680 [Afipia carboxidovorans]